MKAFVFVLLGTLLLSTPAMAQLVPYEIQPPVPLPEKVDRKKPILSETPRPKYEIQNEWSEEEERKFQVRLDDRLTFGEIETADPLHRRRGQPGPGDTIGFEWKKRR